MFSNTKNKATKLIASFVLCANLVAVPTFSQAETLRSHHVVVTDNVVRLGDIFDVDVVFADEELFQSPPLGRNGVLTAKMLNAIASKFSLDWLNTNLVEKITVARKSKTITADDIKNIIAQYAIDNQHVAGEVAQTHIKFNQHVNDIVIAQNEYINFVVSNFVYRPLSDQFSVEFRFVRDGKYQTKVLNGKLENLIKIPVFTQNIRRGQIVTADDVKFIQINHRNLVSNIVIDSADLIGKTAKNTVRAMQPINHSLLKYPDLVTKNTIINLKFKMGRIQLSIKARALKTGAKGALIRVMNIESGKLIDAIVIGKDQAMTINSDQKPATMVAFSE